jgi:hypothetical protein
VNVAILEDMPKLDFKTPFDELSELRKSLTTQQIAELTGLRRETISRARPDSRFQRRTEKALGDLYLVVSAMKLAMGDDLGQLAAVLRRPQALLGERSMAELLKEGRVGAILEHLEPPTPSGDVRLDDVQFDPATLAALSKSEGPSAATSTSVAEERRVSALIEADAELASRLPAIESKIHDRFGPDARIERAIVTEHGAPEGRDHLYLGVRTALSFDDEIERLADLLSDEEELLAPVRARLTIGTL